MPPSALLTFNDPPLFYAFICPFDDSLNQFIPNHFRSCMWWPTFASNVSMNWKQPIHLNWNVINWTTMTGMPHQSGNYVNCAAKCLLPKNLWNGIVMFAVKLSMSRSRPKANRKWNRSNRRNQKSTLAHWNSECQRKMEISGRWNNWDVRQKWAKHQWP